MRFQTSDPDIETIVRRIGKTIDLQPDFQRGEVWSTPKKQRLIDTILRRWHVPPIHLVARGDAKFDVLDGQQRLTAIRDFVGGEFAVDGRIEPQEYAIQSLHGLRYEKLPPAARDQFDAFAIRVFELHDYKPDEPHELFFRLNQPVTLTEAEKRNAFIGPARNQVSELVNRAAADGLMTAGRLGFSNARMSFEDLLARFLLTLEQNSLSEKVTALRITQRYRRPVPFDDDLVRRAESAIELFFSLPMLDEGSNRLKVNKATIHTWLCVAAKLDNAAARSANSAMRSALGGTVHLVERMRTMPQAELPIELAETLPVFNDRATSRVADVSSVVLRDLVAWLAFYQMDKVSLTPQPIVMRCRTAIDRVRGAHNPERALWQFALDSRWGGSGWF